MSEQCSQRVWNTWDWSSCSRKAVSVEDGKPLCRQHTAAATAEREAKKEQRYQAYITKLEAPGKHLRELEATNAKLLAALEHTYKWLDWWLTTPQARHPTDFEIGEAKNAREQAREAIEEATLDVQKEARGEQILRPQRQAYGPDDVGACV